MTGTAVVEFDWAKYAAEAQRQAPITSARRISCKGGVFALGDHVIGTQMAAIVLDSIWVNTFFSTRFVDGEANAPVCYAYGRSVEEMAPHHTMKKDMSWFRPQSPWAGDRPSPCSVCPKNEWGSADTGAGKACQNRESLAVIPAGFYTPRPRSTDSDLHLIEDPEHYAREDAVKLTLPVMSTTGEWRPYVHKVATTYQRPPFGVITRIYTVPDPKSQFRIKLETLEVLPDHLREVIVQRHTAARETMEEPFSAPGVDGPVARVVRR